MKKLIFARFRQFFFKCPFYKSYFSIFVSFAFLFVPIMVLLTSTGCTRKNGKSTQINLSIADWKKRNKIEPYSSTTEKITKIVINVHGGPRLIEGGWESCHCLPDEQIESPPPSFVLPVDAGSNRLVQVLIVSEDATSGQTVFSYGDQLTNINPGENSVDVTVKSLSTSQASAEAGVRYLRADETSPNGWVDIIYRPPGELKPPMVVHSFFTLGGWMKVHLFQSTPLDYRLRNSGEILFSGVNFSHPDFQTSNYMLKAQHPTYYLDRQRDGLSPYEAMPARTIFLGFAGPGASTSGKVVCYDPIDNWNLTKAWQDSSGNTLLQWSGSTANANQFSRQGGGIAKNISPCLSGIDFVNKITLQQDQLQTGWTSALFGFDRGFQLLKGPRGLTNANTYYQSHISASQISWKYLPGIFDGPGAAAGVKIFKRLNSSSSDFRLNNERFDCNELPGLGFTEAANLIGAANEGLLLQGLNVSDVYNYRLVVCPYNSAGQFLIGMASQIYDLGNGPAEFGSGSDGSKTISSSISSPSSNTSLLAGKILMAKRRVIGVSADGRSLSLGGSTLNSPYSEFSIGDEIMWMVLADSGPNGCGPELSPGQYGFNQIQLLVTSPAAVTLKAPLVLNGTGVSTSALQSMSIASGNDVCRIFIQRVPHFENLTFNPSAAITISADSVNSNLEGGGLLAFRVLNNLTFQGSYSATLDASAKGFAGGTYSSPPQLSMSGQGYLGEITNFSSYLGNAGGSSTSLGGGGGAGASGSGGNGGGSSGSSSGGQGGQSLGMINCGGYCDFRSFIFYGGGGGSGNLAGGTGSGATGGKGGGVIFVSAKNILQPVGSTGVVNLSANGAAAINTSSADEDAGGGGGGGTVLIKTKNLETSLQLSAKGGDGGNAVGSGGTNTTRGGGGGGGGQVLAFACASTFSFQNPNVAGGNPGTGHDSNGASGSNGQQQTNITQNAGPFCY